MAMGTVWKKKMAYDVTDETDIRVCLNFGRERVHPPATALVLHQSRGVLRHPDNLAVKLTAPNIFRRFR